MEGFIKKHQIRTVLSGIFLCFMFVWACTDDDGENAGLIDRYQTFIRTYGGFQEDTAHDLIVSPDGGYVLVGTSLVSQDNYDATLIKVDSSGEVLWQRFIGESYRNEQGRAACFLSDGSIVVAGYGAVNNGKDIFAGRWTSSGEHLWFRSYEDGEMCRDIQVLQDDRIIILTDGRLHFIDSEGDVLDTLLLGNSWSEVFEINSDHDDYVTVCGKSRGNKAQVLKIDLSNGVFSWFEYHGLEGCAYSIDSTSDGGYVVCGDVKVDNQRDMVLFKLDFNFYSVWSHTIGGDGWQDGWSVREVDGGGLIITGGNRGADDNMDVWLVRTDSSGNILWSREFGENKTDRGLSVRRTRDGGFAVLGYSDSYSKGDRDLLLVKTDDQGHVANPWNPTPTPTPTPPLPGTFLTTLEKMNQVIGHPLALTSDGGYAVAGLSVPFSKQDAVLSKLDSSGTLLWQKKYDTGIWETPISVITRADGGFVLVGYSRDENHERDFLVITTDSLGNQVWLKTVDMNHSEWASDAVELPDRSLLVAGTSEHEAALIKLDPSGNLVWQHTYTQPPNGLADFTIHDLEPTSDGNFVLGGYSDYFSSSNVDGLLIKVDPEGNYLWHKRVGSPEKDYIYAVREVSDKGFILAGYTRSSDHTLYDIVIIKTNHNGVKQWVKTLGGERVQIAYNMIPTIDDGYVLTGIDRNNDPLPSEDILVMKIDNQGNELWRRTIGGNYRDLGYAVQQAETGGFVLCGITESYGLGDNTVILIKTDPEGNL